MNLDVNNLEKIMIFLLFLFLIVFVPVGILFFPNFIFIIVSDSWELSIKNILLLIPAITIMLLLMIVAFNYDKKTQEIENKKIC